MQAKAAILGAKTIRSEVKEIPEWGVKVTLQTMTAAERVQIGMLADEHPNSPWDVLVLVVGLRDEKGEKVFDGTAEEIAALAQQDGQLLRRIGAELQALSGMTPAAAQAEKKA